jgi:hypothetical protein
MLKYNKDRLENEQNNTALYGSVLRCVHVTLWENQSNVFNEEVLLRIVLLYQLRESNLHSANPTRLCLVR